MFLIPFEEVDLGEFWEVDVVESRGNLCACVASLLDRDVGVEHQVGDERIDRDAVVGFEQRRNDDSTMAVCECAEHIVERWPTGLADPMEVPVSIRPVHGVKHNYTRVL